jgi:hypothetical protein
MSIPAEGQTSYSHTGQTSGLPVELLCLATLFNIQISGLPDRFPMEIGENVNPGTEELES